jgi:arylsulfatase A-like enzyme
VIDRLRSVVVAPDERHIRRKRRGVKNVGEFNDARLIDLAPTILHLMDLPVPRDMDGRVLTEAIADSRAVEYSGTSEGQAATEGYSGEEEAQVIERLKDLGYIS